MIDHIAAPTELLKGVHARLQAARFAFVDAQVFGRNRVIRRFRLESNGLIVITLVDKSAPIFAYHTWYRVGSRHERVGRTGMAHLFEHMMFKATTTMGDGEFDRVMERRGAQTNAATWVDWTYYHEALPSTAENLELAPRLEADRMINLVLNDDQLESEREVVKNERRYRVDDDPDGRAYEALYHLALDGHPYGWPTIGWMQDIEAITLADCQEFYGRYYAPNNAVIVVVGDFDLEAALVAIGTQYGPLEAQDLPAEPPAPIVTVDHPRRRELELPVTTERLLMGYVGPALRDADAPAADVALEVLFGGESARLHRRLVFDDELASSVGGWASHFEHPGLLEVSAVLKEGHTADEAEAVILEEFARLVSEPPTDRELEKARNQLEIAIYRSNYSANAVAGRLGHYEVTAGDYREFQAAVEATRRVDAADVQRAVRRYLRPEARCVVTVRPSAEPS